MQGIGYKVLKGQNLQLHCLGIAFTEKSFALVTITYISLLKKIVDKK